jgi:hypothetical protein
MSYGNMMETTELFSLVSLFWKNLEAHCFHYFLTVVYGSQSEDSAKFELPESSKTVKTVKTVLRSPSFCHRVTCLWSTADGFEFIT